MFNLLTARFDRMTPAGRTLLCLLASLVLVARSQATSADTPGNPYQAIVERNVFGLKPPPAPAETEPAKPPPPKITLTGIFTMGGKHALLSTPPQPGKAAGESRAQYFTLAEGQRDGEIEVLEINERARTVKVSYGGAVQTLDFKENGVKAAPAPQVGMTAALPRVSSRFASSSRELNPVVGETLALPPNADKLVAALPAVSQVSQLDPDQQARMALTPIRCIAGNGIPGWRRSVRPPDAQ